MGLRVIEEFLNFFYTFKLFTFIIRSCLLKYITFFRMMLLENCLVEKWRDQLSKRSIVSIISNSRNMDISSHKEIL